MSKPQILLLGEIDQYALPISKYPPSKATPSHSYANICNSAKKEWAALSSIGELIEPKARSREEFIAECKKGAFDKVVVAYRTFPSVAITGLVDEELVAALPEGLKFIAHNGT